MKTGGCRSFVAFLFAFLISTVALLGESAAQVAPALLEDERPSHVANSRRGVVASVNPIATKAGIAAMERGGNAIDAALATALMLGVVDNHNSGLGGGCFILIRRSDGEVLAIDGREAAPASATRDMFLTAGKGDTTKSQLGPLASGVPGAFAAYVEAAELAGKLPLKGALLEAAKVAEDGFRVDRVYAQRLAAHVDEIRQFPGTAAVLLHEDGTPYQDGELLRQRDLAETYRGLATQGRSYFYEGPVSKRIADWMKANGGLITEDDFASYQAKHRTPIRTEYRGHEIIGFPPPSSGGVHVAEILNILESFDLAEMNREDPGLMTHVVVEAMKLAFADRAHWLGDADFVDVPLGLIDPAYGKELAGRIDLNQASEVLRHGQPPGAEDRFFQRHTTHLTAADAEGNWVAITQTVNTSFGSKVIVPGTGVVLNNEMDDFSVAPGVPNAFGLVGAEANAVEPQKRPLSSMSPTLVLRDGRPVMSVGAAGGPTIITQSLLAVIRVIDLKQDIGQAIAGPRFHHQWSPDRVLVERDLPEEIVAALESRGHRVERTGGIGVSQGLEATVAGLVAARDPRVPGLAEGLADKPQRRLPERLVPERLAPERLKPKR